MQTYTATTEGIRVNVRPVYLDGQSDPISRKFVFAYYIHIDNFSTERVQLLRRHWTIHHGSVKQEVVDGEGVIGVQPVIPSGGSHEYNSFCILETMEGWMEGSYLMQKVDGSILDVVIPRFPLRAAAN